MISSFDRALGLTCFGAAFALAACGGATSSPETVHDGSVDGMTTAHHDGSTTHDAAPKSDAKTGSDANTLPHDTGTPPGDGGAPSDATPTTDGGCPAAEPMNRSACTTAGDMCTYAAGDCSCAMGGMGTLEWRCAVPCPTTVPEAGSACMGGGGMGGGGRQTCTFGALDCACTNNAWTCSTCPTTAPTAGTACTLGGELCGYDAGACRCSGTGGMGMPTDAGADAAVVPTEAWKCGGACPTAQPDAGSACTTVAGELCTYGMTTCDCIGGTFHCQ